MSVAPLGDQDRIMIYGPRRHLHRRVQDGRRRETLTAPAGKEV